MAGETYSIDLFIDITGDKAAVNTLDSLGKKIDRIRQQSNTLSRVKASPSASLKDGATPTINKIRSSLMSLSSHSWAVTIKAKDLTFNTLSSIKSNLLSLQGVAAMAITAIGVGKVGTATLGAAMDFEAQAVSMEHWLKGDKQKSDQFIKWLDVLAAKTPFEMADIFPAGARAVGVSDGELGMAKQLVTLSADMAGLTPGKTIKDAMEALADAQMGEFERMKEFGMKFSKEKMDAAGGFAGFLKQAEGKFAGGAEKLSATAKGRISTITDFIKTQFRSVGMGMLESLSPRLQKITQWLDNNGDTVAKWKDRLIKLGRDSFERMLSWGERTFDRLRKIIEDPGFQNADWGTKVGMLLNEVLKSMTGWLEGSGGKALVGLGATMGKFLAEAMIETFMGLMMEHPILRTVAMGYAGGVMAGAPGAAVGVGASVVAEVPIQAAKSAERKQEAQMEQIRETGRVIDDFKENPNKYRVEGGELKPQRNWWDFLSPQKHANGGILSRPHLGMVAEAGPEAIIPLSSQLRGRALNLWQQTGSLLGANAASSGGGDVYISGVDVALSLEGGDVDEEALALRIGKVIVAEIKKAWENRG